MDKITISVIVCTYNREKYIGKNLQALSNQTFSPEQYEIIIVDNNSHDNTRAICRKFIEEHPAHNIKYFLESSQGHSYARNRGIEESVGEIISFIDDDAFVNSNFIENIHKFFASNIDVLAIGGKITPLFEGSKPKWMSKYLLPLVAGLDLGQDPKEFPKTKFPIGANMAYRKEVFAQLGNFNTDLGRRGTGLEGGDEKDMIFRLRKAGGKVWYAPSVTVRHIIPPTRTTIPYIKNQAMGVGKSEKKRLRKASLFQKLSKVTSELIKIGGTIVLAIYYSISWKFAKSIMLVRFRFWVFLGYISNE